MEKNYLVWREDEERDDAKPVKADYPEQAAKRWAAWTDTSNADYSIIGGQEERVFVALDAEGSEPEMFAVSGESMPVYFAKAVSTPEAP